MLSRNCDGCSQLKTCKNRFIKVKKGEKVYCPDGTVNLVDKENEFLIRDQILTIKN